jgi:hypothetical protein
MLRLLMRLQKRGRRLRGGLASVLEELDLVQHLVAIERPNVPRLRRGQATNRPAEVNEVRLDGMREWMHPDLLWKTVALSRVTRAARGHDVIPVVCAATRERNQVIAREGLAKLQLGGVAAAVLTAVAIAREEEGVRHLPPEPPRNVDELREANDGRPRHRKSLGADDFVMIRFDDFGLPIDHEAKCSSHRDHGERLERRIQSQAANDHAEPPESFVRV